MLRCQTSHGLPGPLSAVGLSVFVVPENPVTAGAEGRSFAMIWDCPNLPSIQKSIFPVSNPSCHELTSAFLSFCP